MGQLHCALEVSDFSGQHDAGTAEELFDHPVGVEEGRSHLGPMVTEGDAQPLAFPSSAGFLVELRLHITGLGVGDDVDESDVLSLFEAQVLVLTTNGHPLAVLARVMPKEVVDGAYPEVLLELSRVRSAEDELEAIRQPDHATPPRSAARRRGGRCGRSPARRRGAGGAHAPAGRRRHCGLRRRRSAP